MARYVIYSADEARASRRLGEEAAYWHNDFGWVPLESAEVFDGMPSSVPLGDCRVLPAPPQRLPAYARVEALGRLQRGDVVWLHDPEERIDPLLRGRYVTLVGDTGSGFSVWAVDVGAHTVPHAVVHPPQGINEAIAFYRDQAVGGMILKNPFCVQGMAEPEGDHGRLRVGLMEQGAAPEDWFASQDLVLRLEWPFYPKVGDEVLWRDPDAGMCSGRFKIAALADPAGPDTRVDIVPLEGGDQGTCVRLLELYPCTRFIEPPWITEAQFEELGGLIAPDEGGYFEIEDEAIADAPSNTVWAAIEQEDESLVLVPGFARFERVLGYLRSERPWVDENEGRVLWYSGCIDVAELDEAPGPARSLMP